MKNTQMLDNVLKAKNLLDDVYYNVSNNKLSTELERLLSVIDTCILESIDLIDTIIDTKGE